MADTQSRLDGEAVPEMGQPLSFREHLVNSLVNSSLHAGEIYETLKHLLELRNPNEGRDPVKREIYSAMRRAVTVRDTHKQLAELVRGEDLDTRDLRREREAEIYMRLQRMQQDLGNRVPMFVSAEVAEGIRQEIEDIKQYIREDNSVN